MQMEMESLSANTKTTSIHKLPNLIFGNFWISFSLIWCKVAVLVGDLELNSKQFVTKFGFFFLFYQVWEIKKKSGSEEDSLSLLLQKSPFLSWF
ncbi:hypothetical protein ACOSQ2_014022 [Xanthoceras sorbifolium]